MWGISEKTQTLKVIFKNCLGHENDTDFLGFTWRTEIYIMFSSQRSSDYTTLLSNNMALNSTCCGGTTPTQEIISNNEKLYECCAHKLFPKENKTYLACDIVWPQYRKFDYQLYVTHIADLLWEKFRCILPLYMKPVSCKSKASVAFSITTATCIDFDWRN